MATDEGSEEKIYKSPSHLIVNRQLQDLVRTQNVAIVKLQCMLKRREITVPHEDYQAIVSQLDDEKLEHMKTKTKLAEETEKLQFAQGEIEMLKNQLTRDRKTFENAFKNLKSKAVVESEKNDELYNKCLEMEEMCTQKDDGLAFQDAKIKDLRNRVTKQKQVHKHMLSSLDIELKQEQYVARHLQGISDKNLAKNPLSVNTRRKSAKK